MFNTDHIWLHVGGETLQIKVVNKNSLGGNYGRENMLLVFQNVL